MSIPVTLVGGRGYTGEVLLSLLAAHPVFSVERVGSRSLAGRRLAEVYPRIDSALVFESLEPEDLEHSEGGIVLALANGESASWIAGVPEDVAIVDLSADHRFDDGWVYGLPELNREAIGGARRIANPGCYATAGQLALAPCQDMLRGAPALFGVSGYSGAGRTPNPRNDAERLADSLIPYSLTGHVHEREIGHRLGCAVRFMPHVAAFFRGISVTVAAELTEGLTAAELAARFRDFYATSPLLRISETAPEIREYRDTPLAAIGGFEVDARDPRRAVWVSVLDNLLKGAASQAIQNLNLAFGLDELMGLSHD